MKVTLSISAMLIPVAVFAAGLRPQAPENFVATADEAGLLKATVTLTAPTLSTDGTPLSEIDKIELKRGGSVVKVFDNVACGETYEFIDTSVTNGYTMYTACAYSRSTEGETASSNQIFVGVDIPLAPAQLKAAADENKISFTWPKVGKKGLNGQRVIQNGVTYELDLLDSNYSPMKTLTDTKGQTYDYYYPCNKGDQDLIRFGLKAYNAAGYSDYTYTRLVVGAPYMFPLRESFGGGSIRTFSWQEGDGTFSPVTSESYDSDAGALACMPADNEVTSFNLGKLSMANTLNPRMSFRITGLADGEKINVRVARSDGAEATLKTLTGPIDEWTLVTIDLSALRRESYIVPKFQFAAGNENIVYLDDIIFEDPYTHDLAVMVKAPETAIGQTPVEIEVTNVGLTEYTPAEMGTVSIYVNGKATETLSLTESVQPGQTVTLNTTANITGEESVEVKAHLFWVFDINPYNDTASAQVLPESRNEANWAGVDTVLSEPATTTIYLPDGRKVASDDVNSLPKGIYIINGRKVIVK